MCECGDGGGVGWGWGVGAGGQASFKGYQPLPSASIVVKRCICLVSVEVF